MPNSKSAEKSLRQSKKRQAHNKRYKNRIKKVARQIDDAVDAGNKKEAEKLLPTYFKAVDKAAKRNILHKNTAARRKSLYAKKVSGKEKVAQEATATESSSQDK